MVKMNNKGFIHTLEAIIAILLLLSILFVSISLRKAEPNVIPVEIELLQKNILDEIQNNEEYRNYLFDDSAGSTALIEDLLDSRVSSNLAFAFDICEEPDISVCLINENLPENKNIYSESIILQEKINDISEYRIFRLYLWYI